MSKPLESIDELKAILRRNPSASRKDISDKMFRAFSKNEKVRYECFEYWFKNHFRKFSVEVFGPHSIAVKETLRKYAKDRKRHKAKVDAVVSHILVLMDHVLTCGKLLSEATFGDCFKEAGWLHDIAKLGKANEVVGVKLTEAQVRDIYARHHQGNKKAA